MKNSSKRAIKYQKKARRRGLCPKCKSAVARACEKEECAQKGVLVLERKCPACKRETIARRLCIPHLEYDKERNAEKRAKQKEAVAA